MLQYDNDRKLVYIVDHHTERYYGAPNRFFGEDLPIPSSFIRLFMVLWWEVLICLLQNTSAMVRPENVGVGFTVLKR